MDYFTKQEIFCADDIFVTEAETKKNIILKNLKSKKMIF